MVHSHRNLSEPHPAIRVAAIDEKSISSLGRWPWSRSVQARLILSLKKANAQVIALDIVYSSEQTAETDKKLTEAIKVLGSKTIGGYFFRNQQSILPEKKALDALFDQRIKAVFSSNQDSDKNTQLSSNFVETNITKIQTAFNRLGFFNYIPDPDGLLRQMPLVLPFKNEYYPSLVLQSLSTFTDSPIVLNTSSDGINSLQLGSVIIPTDHLGRMALNFYPKDQSIAIYSAIDILEGKHNAQLNGKLVFVGVTELGIADVRPTPLHNSFPGVLAHATAASNILQKIFSYRGRSTTVFDVAALLILPLILISFMARSNNLVKSSAIFVVLTSLFTAVYYWLLTQQGWLVSIVYPVFSLLITFIAYQIWSNLVSQQQTRFIQKAFASYVSPSVVKEIIKNPDTLSLRGKEQQISLIFSDIRDFTTISEQLPATQMVSMLNQYMDTMTRIIMQHNGTLDKYIGDAIMAIYNAPVAIENHAVQAALSAIKMKQNLTELNKIFSAQNNLELDIGIGIHTGRAVVGNMGSELRFDYTAIGDNVNLASRLENATKYYGVAIIISHDTYEQIKYKFNCRELDRLQVKGKNNWITIYELIDLKIDKSIAVENKIRLYSEILDHYYNNNFAQAIDKLEQFLIQFETDGPALMLIERCRDFISKPPDHNWNGVYVAKDKF